METLKDIAGVAAIIGLLAAATLLPQPEPHTPSPTEIQQSIETETGITAPTTH